VDVGDEVDDADVVAELQLGVEDRGGHRRACAPWARARSVAVGGQRIKPGLPRP
jgi:hypothetical protein